MKYVDFEVNTGEKNMQIDSDLLDFAIENQLKEPIFRLYAWSPACVSLGRNQSENFLDKEFLKSKNIDVVRRLTGGRALLHDKELTYSFICSIKSLKNGESVVNSYKEISQILIDGFEKLGIKLGFGNECSIPSPLAGEGGISARGDLPPSDRNSGEGYVSVSKQGKKAHTKIDYCMSISTGADLSYEGKKLIGSAQFRKEGYILQHGSILFNYDKDLIEQLFAEKVDENLLTCLEMIKPELSFEEVVKIFSQRCDVLKISE